MINKYEKSFVYNCKSKIPKLTFDFSFCLNATSLSFFQRKERSRFHNTLKIPLEEHTFLKYKSFVL